jgi:ABC-type Fe3+-hydroxamate transport system substrate-binding protein
VPSQTELLVALGLQDRLIGITKFCVHPGYLRKSCTVVGGTKNIKRDKIVALHPDLIICNKEENSEEIVEQLLDIAPVWISDIVKLEDALGMIRGLGKITACLERAEGICSEILNRHDQFKIAVKKRPKIKVAYLIWKDPYMAAGQRTFINSMLALNNFENIVQQHRYPEITAEELKNAELILLSSEPFPFTIQHKKLLEETLEIKTSVVDGTYFSWYGSRLLDAFDYFETLA